MAVEEEFAFAEELVRGTEDGEGEGSWVVCFWVFGWLDVWVNFCGGEGGSR